MVRNGKRLRQFFPLFLFAAAFLAPQMITSNYLMGVLNRSLAFSIGTLGIYVILGLAGQMSMAQAAFFSIGAYGTGVLCTKFGMPPFFSVIIGVVLSGIAGLIIGLPTLKLSGRYLTITTLGFTIIIKLVFDNWKSVTNGADGLAGIPAFSIFGFEFSGRQRMYYFALIVLGIVMFLIYRFQRGEFGLGLKMIRDNEEAAMACGINVAFYKTVAFILGGMLGGLGGAVYAHVTAYIQPGDFTQTFSQTLLVMLVVGGYRVLAGSVIGGIIITLLPEYTRLFQDYSQLIFGVVIVVIMAVMPSGLCGCFQSGFGWLKHKYMEKKSRA